MPHPRDLDAVEEALEIVLAAFPLEFQIGGQRLSLKQRWLYFREYTGPHPKNSLGKPIVGAPDRPFAELQAVKRLEHQGWTASWLYGSREFIVAWEPREETQPSSDSYRASGTNWLAGSWKCEPLGCVRVEAELRFIQRCEASILAGCREGSEQSQNCSNQRYTQEQENGLQDPHNPWVIVHPIRHPSRHSGPP